MPKRSYSGAGAYRYGFNGKENDNEIKGLGNQQDYGMRIYDARIGKFLSVDPLTADYPSWSPYPFAMNRPIDGVDLDGLEWQPVNAKGQNVAPNSEDIADYTWSGYNSDGSVDKGTVGQASLYKNNQFGLGKSLWSYSSDSKDKSGHISILHIDKNFDISTGTTTGSATNEYDYEISIRASGQHRGRMTYGGASASISRNGQVSPEVNLGSTGVSSSGAEMLNNASDVFGLSRKSDGIVSDGLGPIDYLLAIGELKMARSGAKIIGSAQSTGTFGHSFTSKLIAWRYALDPRVERVTLDLGYKRLLGGGTFKWGPRPDVGILFKNGRTKTFEVLSRTQFEVGSDILNKNLLFMRRNSITGSTFIMKPFSLKSLYK